MTAVSMELNGGTQLHTHTACRSPPLAPHVGFSAPCNVFKLKAVCLCPKRGPSDVWAWTCRKRLFKADSIRGEGSQGSGAGREEVGKVISRCKDW